MKLNKLISIGFQDNSNNIQLGSYRIYINDLNYYFNEIGIDSSICGKDCNVEIYPKIGSFVPNKNKLIGVINPNSDDFYKLKNSDFAIVGSVEEKESILPYIKNVFVFPQIEKMYMNVNRKVHEDKDQIIIGYHGNPNHLNHMDLGLSKALERLSKVKNIKLLVIKSALSPISDWKIGKPNILIEYVDWNIKDIKQNIQNFDIGIVPNICQYKNGSFRDQNLQLGVYGTDVQIKFKNKSNIGRSLVLIQNGIPVVTDITPSNMSLFFNPDNGYSVLTEEGWYRAMLELCDPIRRNEVSQNAYDEYERQYDPLKWSSILYNQIYNLFVKKFSKI